ncbi:hypothetical protein JB92DRAFT_2959197 [Gautieria morchelliformis]|nr:hypothetical protein JB92DRAFT_2959197 [Gautieria morchelliformis]
MASSSSKRKRDADEDNEDYYDNWGFFDDESEPHKFGTSVLPVANLPDSFEAVPQDGMEYLFTVRREGRQLPLVTRVSNPYAVPEENQHGSDMNAECTSSTSMNSIPSQEWRACFEERFRNLRANMRQPTIHTSLPLASGACKLPQMRDRDRWWAFFRGDVEWENVDSSPFHSIKREKWGKQKRETAIYDEALPQGVKMRGCVVYEEHLSWDQVDEDGVVGLSYGDDMNTDLVKVEDEGEDGEIWNKESPIPDGSVKEEAEGFVLPTLRDSHSSPTAVNDTLAISGDGLGPREPTSHILSLVDQKTILHLLKFFSQWIQGHFDRSFLPPPPPSPPYHPDSPGNGKRLYDLTPGHGRWIFALLSCLDGQLTSKEISVLRNLARECVKLIREERSLQEASPQISSTVPCMGETACWIIVAAVSGGWGQKDLWADAADTLGSQ